MTWQERFLAMMEMKDHGHKVALAYIQGRALEASETALRRSAGVYPRQLAVKVALLAMAEQSAEAAKLLD